LNQYISGFGYDKNYYHYLPSIITLSFRIIIDDYLFFLAPILFSTGLTYAFYTSPILSVATWGQLVILSKGIFLSLNLLSIKED